MSIASVQQESGSPTIVMPRLSVEMAGVLASAFGASGRNRPLRRSDLRIQRRRNAVMDVEPCAHDSVVDSRRRGVRRRTGDHRPGPLGFGAARRSGGRRRARRDCRRVVRRRAVGVAGTEERQRLQPDFGAACFRILDRLLARSWRDPDRARLVLVRALSDAARRKDSAPLSILNPVLADYRDHSQERD